MGSYAKAHQHSTDAASKKDEAKGQAEPVTQQIRLAVDACGLPVAFDVT
jgi:hypothetical protein